MKSTLNPKNNSKLYYSDAMKMISEYKSKHENDSDYLASEYFDKEAIERILSNPKCKGIRISNAIQTEDGVNQNRLILMGIDENGKAIINYKIGLSAASAASIGNSVVLENMPLENGKPCPPC